MWAMALTFTVTALQTELSSYGEAMALATAAGYVTARAALRKARAIRMGLPDSVESVGPAKTALPNLSWFEAAEKQIDDLEEAVTTTDRRRLFRTGLQHG